MKRLIAIAVIGLLSLTACGPAAEAAFASPEQSALAAIGFSEADLVADESTPTPGTPGTPGERATTGGPRKLKLAKVALRRNVLHGDAVVQTKDGVITVAVQRGAVTAIDGKTMTVKSADGYTLTWTFGDPIDVIEHRTSVAPSAITVGTEVGVAGPTDGTTSTARLIVVPTKK